MCLGLHAFHNIAGLPVESHLADGYIRAEIKPTRVDEREFAPIPVGVAIDAITRGAGQVLDDGDAFADHAIKKCRFADVWPANNGDKRLHMFTSTLS